MPLQNDFETSIKNMVVDLADSGTHRETLMVMQGDKGTRFARITVLNDGHPANLTNVYAVLRGVKKDGTTIFNGCEVENNKIIAELTQNILSVDGIGRYEIALYGSDPTVETKAITYADLNPVVTTNTGFGISPNGNFMTDVSDSTIGTSLFIKVSVNGEPRLIHFYAQESNTDLTLDSIQVRDVLLGLEVSNYTSHDIVANFYKLNASSLWDEVVSSWSTVIPATTQVITPIVISNTTKNGELFSNLCTSDGGKIISSFPFTINVVKSSFNATEMESSNEWTVLNQAMENLPLMTQLNEYVAEVHEAMSDMSGIDDRLDVVETKLGGHTVGIDVPANAVFTDTTYSPADGSHDGLMSSSHYTKLEGISSGAEVNQNAFASFTDGTNTINAGTKQDSVKLIGNNVDIVVSDGNDGKQIEFTAQAGGGSVQPSQINGNIIVDGDEMTVYDDEELQKITEIGHTVVVNDNPVEVLVSYDQDLSPLTTSFKPKQDLNGYLYPSYNGNGKNKLNLSFTTQTINNVTFTVNSDKTITLSGTSDAQISVTLSNLMSDGLVSGRAYKYSIIPEFPTAQYNISCSLRGSDTDLPYYDGTTDYGGNGITYRYPVESQTRLQLVIKNGFNTDGIILRPMAVEYDSTESYTYDSFNPYTNICPIYQRSVSAGHDVYKIQNNQSVGLCIMPSYGYDYCGIEADLLTGKAFIWKFISSYNGESLPDVWISDRDVYAEGTTPTIGAQVAYIDTNDEKTFTVPSGFNHVEAGVKTYYVSFSPSEDSNYDTLGMQIDGVNVPDVDPHARLNFNYDSGTFVTLAKYYEDLSAYATKEYVDNAITAAINGSY